MLIPRVTIQTLEAELGRSQPGWATEEFIREQPIVYEAGKQLAPSEDSWVWIVIGMTFVYRCLKLQLEQEVMK